MGRLPINLWKKFEFEAEGHGGSVIECLNPNRGVAASRLIGDTALCP